ncbi:LysR family transcriptional regulator [Eilatimonas milleporae]|uniref:DNA-binding transcriptional LysR family regulator n=1 Tax=Eilatimonas milleporae TaxID=911205 RepID=A0A3M0CYG1_9PROT|nr:LysR family transcriptional regulator [Eilatimonas milleporae]RMB12689.1 DNA-binding transcriptional LysR family regulator [Eilatimonas milleporae]
MDLIALETYCRAVEAGNLTRAAQMLHVTKSVVSRRLAALEEDLEVRLLTRTTRGVTPTDEGQQFYERAVRILDDVEDARQSLNTADGPLVGRLRLTAPQSFTDLCLGEALCRFMDENPKLKMDIDLKDERVDIVGAGYDVGLRIATELHDTSLIARKIAPISFVTVASPAYLKQHGVPVTPQDFATNHRAVFYANKTVQNEWSFMVAGREETVRPDGFLVTNSGKLQASAAINGLGVARLPRFFVADALTDGRLTEILSDSRPGDGALYAMFPERRHLPAKVRRLIDFLINWFADPSHRQGL